MSRGAAGFLGPRRRPHRWGQIDRGCCGRPHQDLLDRVRDCDGGVAPAGWAQRRAGPPVLCRGRRRDGVYGVVGLQYRPRQLGQLLGLLREDEVVRAHGLRRGPRRRRYTTCSVDAHACMHTAAVPRTNPPREHHLRSAGKRRISGFWPCRAVSGRRSSPTLRVGP